MIDCLLSGGREHEGIVVSVQHGVAFLDFYCADAHGVARCQFSEGYMEISIPSHLTAHEWPAQT